MSTTTSKKAAAASRSFSPDITRMAAAQERYSALVRRSLDEIRGAVAAHPGAAPLLAVIDSHVEANTINQAAMEAEVKAPAEEA